MTVTEIQSVVASYLQKNVAKFDIPGTGVNLVLLAMNNARKYAEKRHNWNVCRKKGYFSVTTSNKVALDSPTWFEGGSEKLKEGKHWWLRGSNNVVDETVEEDRVLKVIDQGVKYRLEAEKEYGGTWWEERNERQDRTNTVQHPLLMQPYAVSRGKWFELYPKPTETKIVVVDGYKWWDNWIGGDEIIRTWRFSESDIVMTPTGGSLSVTEFLLKKDFDNNATDQRLACSFFGPSGISGGVGQAAFQASIGNLATLVQEMNKFIGGGSVELDGTDVVVTLKGVNPYLWVYTYLSNGTVIEDFGPSVSSEIQSGSYSDWWTENAEEFLILRSLVEANRLGQAFVGNKEGNLPPPVKEAEAALELLIRQDEDMKMAGGAIEIY